LLLIPRDTAIRRHADELLLDARFIPEAMKRGQKCPAFISGC
jgi:hypothetical protein